MGVPARDAAGGGKGRSATFDRDFDAGFAGRRAGTPAPLLNFPFTRLPCCATEGVHSVVIARSASDVAIHLAAAGMDCCDAMRLAMTSYNDAKVSPRDDKRRRG
jgi:hypothetical protein